MEVKVPKEKPLRTSETLATAAAPAKIALEQSSTETAALTSVASSLPSPTAAAAAAAAVMDTSGAESDLQKKLRRAERFGMPVKLSEEEKRSSRAERFGTAPISHGKSEEEKRKARAERFGTAGKSTSDEEAKKKARLDRFGTTSKASSVEEEKMKARALRFSESNNPVVSSHTNGKSNPGEDPAVDKSSKKT